MEAQLPSLLPVHPPPLTLDPPHPPPPPREAIKRTILGWFGEVKMERSVVTFLPILFLLCHHSLRTRAPLSMCSSQTGVESPCSALPNPPPPASPALIPAFLGGSIPGASPIPDRRVRRSWEKCLAMKGLNHRLEKKYLSFGAWGFSS
jgi:hypothetical protein